MGWFQYPVKIIIKIIKKQFWCTYINSNNTLLYQKKIKKKYNLTEIENLNNNT